VLQALAMLGLPASWLGVTLHQIATESGGNPNIGNFSDSNAAAGHPSMGLLQVIGPTFAAYRDPRARPTRNRSTSSASSCRSRPTPRCPTR
jgi:SLT domain-containing protein